MTDTDSDSYEPSDEVQPILDDLEAAIEIIEEETEQARKHAFDAFDQSPVDGDRLAEPDDTALYFSSMAVQQAAFAVQTKLESVYASFGLADDYDEDFSRAETRLEELVSEIRDLRDAAHDLSDVHDHDLHQHLRAVEGDVYGRASEVVADVGQKHFDDFDPSEDDEGDEEDGGDA